MIGVQAEGLIDLSSLRRVKVGPLWYVVKQFGGCDMCPSSVSGRCHHKSISKSTQSFLNSRLDLATTISVVDKENRYLRVNRSSLAEALVPLTTHLQEILPRKTSSVAE
jgi:hypothetical protein